LKNTLAVSPELPGQTQMLNIALESESLTPNEVKLITELLPDGFLLLSDSGSILTANPAAHQLFHTDHLVGLALADLVTDPASKVSEWLNRWSASRGMIGYSINLHTDGIGVPVRCEGGLLQAGNTNTPALILARCFRENDAPAADVVRQLKNDIASLQKQLIQQKAQDSQQIAVLRTAAAVFAHEIANPLNAVSTCMQILQTENERHSDGNSVVQEMIESASTEIERLTRLLNDFRSFARPQAIDFRPTPIRKVIEEALALHMAALSTRGIAVDLDLQTLPALMLDSDKMREAILNLLKNAEEAMPGGGRLTITGHVREQEKVAVVEVSDTGIGLPGGVDVFQLFMTTKPGASGLGLPIAAQIIASHGGRIRSIPQRGLGTTFEISMPLCRNS
jgi:signal transduction histidine kinase